MAKRGPGEPASEFDDRLRVLTALADKHLPPLAAADFLASLRPALRLEHAREGQEVVARLGGLPATAVASWPAWDEYGPLAHVLSFRCGPVSMMLPELGLPADGELAFFYLDQRPDFFQDAVVGTWDASTRPGFRVLHLLPGGISATPPGLVPLPAVELAAIRTLTWPSYDAPAAEAVWGKHGLSGPREGMPAPAVDALYEALEELSAGGGDVHQIGGHPHPQQNPVEYEAEELRHGLLDEPFDASDPEVQAAAVSWQLLLQVASDDDADMMWGDAGQLYYLVQDAQQPEEALFTWQCG
ncbi:DUF1963 domain-containing protein [Kribbella deserti]|uniref:DUF1963 domain-containing protein n=1 Tax=Kribbella deserti TaxID=1926257 RepID=A0ABV6QU96_9ACTN